MDHIMDSMMRSMMVPFSDIFGAPPCGPMFGQQQGRQQNPHQQMMQQHQSMMFGGSLMPGAMFGMDPFQQLANMSTSTSMSNGPAFSYSSSSVTSYTMDEQGRPQVRQQTHSSTAAPNGVRETKSTLRDTRTGHNEMAIGHHLHDKGHVKKRVKNTYTGEEEQVDELLNLDEEEASQFDQEWEQKARSLGSGLANGRHAIMQSGHNHHNRNRLAITAGPEAPICPSQPRYHYHSGDPSSSSSRRSRTADTNTRAYPPPTKAPGLKPKKAKSTKRHDKA